MKLSSLTRSATLLATFLATVSTINAQPPGRGEGRGEDVQAMVDRVLNFDKDEDGKLSKDETPERLQGMFARADRDEDGFLTKDEIRRDLENRERGEGGEGRGRGPGGREGEGRGPGGMPPFPVMMALDANHDGEISAEEINNATAALKKLDRNKDGRLDREELRPAFGGRGGGPGGEGGRGRGGFGGPPGGGPGAFVDGLLERQDKNGDGKLSGDEIPERMRENLARVDTNNDKVVDRAELEKMAERFQGGGGPGGGPGGRRGEGGGGERRRPPIEE